MEHQHAGGARPLPVHKDRRLREFIDTHDQTVATCDAFVDLLVTFAGAGDQRPLPSVHVKFAQGGGADTCW